MNSVDAFHHSRFGPLAAEMLERLDDMTSTLLERSRIELPQIWLDPSLTPAIDEYTRESIRAEIECFSDLGRIPEDMPAADVEGTRQTAYLGFPLWDLLWGYRAGHATQWATWFDLVEADGALDEAERRMLLEAGSAFFFAYADRLMSLVTDTYTAERERVLASREQRRVQLVREILEGGEVDAETVDYDLDAEHIGVIASGPDAAAAVRELAQRAGRDLLLVPATGDVWWAWIGGSAPLSPNGRDALARLSPPDGTRLAIGLPARGREGFTSSYEQARAAHVAARHGADAVVRFADVALEVLAASDPIAARGFVDRELGGLNGSDTRSARLRETLRAYFAAGHNAAATASALGVHEQTVAARLRAVEERIGSPAAARRAELETALRLREHLG
jgi:hypothetical protein